MYVLLWQILIHVNELSLIPRRQIAIIDSPPQCNMPRLYMLNIQLHTWWQSNNSSRATLYHQRLVWHWFILDFFIKQIPSVSSNVCFSLHFSFYCMFTKLEWINCTAHNRNPNNPSRLKSQSLKTLHNMTLQINGIIRMCVKQAFCVVIL